MDSNLQEFIETKCKVGIEHQIKSVRLHEAYRLWCWDNKTRSLSNRAFKQTLESFGYFHKHHNDANYYHGLDLT